VLPVEENGDFFFDEADVARVRLIAELRNDLGVNEDAIPVVLRLLDQVYSLRRALAELNEAIQALPESAQAQLRDHLSDSDRGEPN
jgi:chaperone modulatory protein CbpM